MSGTTCRCGSGGRVTILRSGWPNCPTPFTSWTAPELFDRPGFYGEAGLDYPDNHIRFAVFSKAALAVARNIFRTDIFHCHDWQAGLVPVYLHANYALDPTFLGKKTVFTIHNLGYQGLFPKTVLPEAGLDETVFVPDGVEFFGQVSYIKGGISYADALTTVSPTYAREIQTPNRFRARRRAGKARRDAHRHPQRSRLRRVEPRDRPLSSGSLLRRRPFR